MAGNCTFCGSPINVDRDYRKVSGWSRERGAAGSTNAVRLKEKGDEWACAPCVDKQVRGVSAEQGALL